MTRQKSSPYQDFPTLREIRGRTIAPLSPRKKTPPSPTSRPQDLSEALSRRFGDPWRDPIILHPEDLTYQPEAAGKIVTGLVVILSLLALFYYLDSYFYYA